MKEVELSEGEKWPYHYRGTRYHFNSEQDVWWQTFKDGMRVYVKKGHERVIKKLLMLKSETGRFNITETGDVITKIQNDKGEYIPTYICEMDEPFVFKEKLDIIPKKIQPGDLWKGFFDGSRYSYIGDNVWWKNPEGYRQYIDEKLPTDIFNNLHRFKAMGGSFRITENGFVITLIPKQPLPNNLKDQWNKLSETQKRLIQTKVESTDMLPIYIGRYHEGITLKPPRKFTGPLSSDEKKKMLDFLDDFSMPKDFEGMVPTDLKEEETVEEFLDDPEDWE